LGEIYKKKNGRFIEDFYISKIYFIIEDGSKIYGKKNTIGNKGLCNKARVEYFIYSINWPSCFLDLNLIKNIWRILKQRLRNRKSYSGWTLEEL
jgi:hypothetical protein